MDEEENKFEEPEVVNNQEPISNPEFTTNPEPMNNPEFTSNPDPEVITENKGGSKAKSIVSLACGIGSLSCCYLWYIGIAAGIVGLIFGIKAKKEEAPNGMSKAGFILSLIGIILSGIWMILSLIGVSLFSSNYYYY